MGVVVGLDVGSRSVRAVALDRDGTVVGNSTAGYSGVSACPPGEAIPARWLDAVGIALGALTAHCGEAAAPAALAVGGQSPTAVASTGDRALTYQFTTGSGEGGLLAQQRAQCAHLARAEPGAEVSQLWDWVLEKLGAPRRQGRWPDDTSIEELGERAETGTVVGESDGTFGIRRGTLLVPGAPDAILTFWAAGLDEPGRGCDPGGHTGGLVVATEDVELPSAMMKMASPAEGCVMVGGPVSAHGASLEWLSHVTARSIAELLELAESSPPGASGVTFLPYLEGERSPRWNVGLTGEFHGITSATGVEDLARAVLEGTAFGLGHIARMLASARVRTSVVTCTGSPSRSRLWCEIKASVLGVPFDVSGFSELSAYGAALAAGAGAGWWPRPATAVAGSWPRPPMTRVEPLRYDGYESLLDSFIEIGDLAERRLTGDT